MKKLYRNGITLLRARDMRQVFKALKAVFVTQERETKVKERRINDCVGSRARPPSFPLYELSIPVTQRYIQQSERV